MYLGDQIGNNEMGRVRGMHGEEQRCKQYLAGNLNESDHVEQVSLRGRILLKWIIKWDGRVQTGFIWLRIRTIGGLFRIQ